MIRPAATVFERAGAALLFLAGMTMVGLAAVVDDRQAVATSLVGFGSALMSLAVLLPRLEGRLKVGVQGVEGQLIAAVHEQAAQRGLSPEATLKAIDAARTDGDAWAGWMEELVSQASIESEPPTSGLRGNDRDPLLRLARRYVEREAAADPSHAESPPRSP